MFLNNGTSTEFSTNVKKFIRCNFIPKELGYHTFCSKWTLKISIENRKNKQIVSSLTILKSDCNDFYTLFDQSITGNETWIKHVGCETKLQSIECFTQILSKNIENACKQCDKDNGNGVFGTLKVYF